MCFSGITTKLQMTRRFRWAGVAKAELTSQSCDPAENSLRHSSKVASAMDFWQAGQRLRLFMFKLSQLELAKHEFLQADSVQVLQRSATSSLFSSIHP